MTKEQMQSARVTTSANVLVIDASISQRVLLKDLLEELGYNVTIAKHGNDALAKFNE